MFFTKEDQTLYLNSWEYNASLILQELKKLVIENGGRVKETRKGYIINCSINECLLKNKERYETITNNIKNGTIENNDTRQACIQKLENEIKELENINNDPVYISDLTCITFILDNKYYYLQLEENPFFDMYYHKTPITNNSYSRDVYIDKLDTNWLFDSFLKVVSDGIENDRKQAAKMIFEQITTAADSEKYYETEKKRVSNIYDSGYHYENIKKPERRAKIDF